MLKNTNGRVTCTDCNAWTHEGTVIRHTSRCSTPRLRQRTETAAETAEATSAAAPSLETVRAAARRGEISAVLDDDQIVKAVRRGWISESDAMNRDF